MTAQYPVHPDDLAQLMMIRRYLIGYRITGGQTQEDLSYQISKTKSMVHDLETNPYWQFRLSRVQDWCAAFDLHLSARLWVGDDDAGHVNQEIHDHPEVRPLYDLSCGQSKAWKLWQRAYLTSALRVARELKGISVSDMAALLGCGPSAVRHWEMDSNELMLPKVLHYARVLGGFVRLRLATGEDDVQS